jgi:hypothetical protein
MKKITVLLLIILYLGISLFCADNRLDRRLCNNVKKVDVCVLSVIYSCIKDMINVLDIAKIAESLISFGEKNDSSSPISRTQSKRQIEVVFIIYQMFFMIQIMFSFCMFIIFLFSLNLLSKSGCVKFNSFVKDRYKYKSYNPRSSISDEVINKFV